MKAILLSLFLGTMIWSTASAYEGDDSYKTMWFNIAVYHPDGIDLSIPVRDYTQCEQLMIKYSKRQHNPPNFVGCSLEPLYGSYTVIKRGSK